jgi:magnesium chelatase family protein
MNPCRCGYANDVARKCSCRIGEPERYVRRVSGPLRDRFDMEIEMSRVPPKVLLSGPQPESSQLVRERILAARQLALARNGGRPNSMLPGTAILTACALTRSSTGVLEEFAAAFNLSARSIHRLLRVARTIADLCGRPGVSEGDVLAAGSLKDPAAPVAQALAA